MPSCGQQVVSCFQNIVDGNYVTAYITPGPMTNSAYKGMAALVLGWEQMAGVDFARQFEWRVWQTTCRQHHGAGQHDQLRFEQQQWQLPMTLNHTGQRHDVCAGCRCADFDYRSILKPDSE